MTTISPRATSTRTTTKTSTSASARFLLVSPYSTKVFASKRVLAWQVDNVRPDKLRNVGVTSSDKIRSISRKIERVRKSGSGGKRVTLPPHDPKLGV